MQIDELIHSDEPIASEEIAALIADVWILLTINGIRYVGHWNTTELMAAIIAASQ